MAKQLSSRNFEDCSQHIPISLFPPKWNKLHRLFTNPFMYAYARFCYLSMSVTRNHIVLSTSYKTTIFVTLVATSPLECISGSFLRTDPLNFLFGSRISKLLYIKTLGSPHHLSEVISRANLNSLFKEFVEDKLGISSFGEGLQSRKGIKWA